MYCVYCGKQLPADALYCNKCGKRQPDPAPAAEVLIVPLPLGNSPTSATPPAGQVPTIPGTPSIPPAVGGEVSQAVRESLSAGVQGNGAIASSASLPGHHAYPSPASPTPPHMSSAPFPQGQATDQLARSLKAGGMFSRRAVTLGVAGATAAVVGGGIVSWVVLTPRGAQNRSSSPTIAATSPPITPTPTLPPGSVLYSYTQHNNKIRVLAWSPDGRMIASGSDDFTAHVWDASTGQNIAVYRDHTSYVEGVAWSPDSKRVATSSADGTVRVREISTGNTLVTYQQGRWVNRIAWSPDGNSIASAEQMSTPGVSVGVHIWEAATGRLILNYRGHTNGVFAVAWSPDGTRLASDGYDGTVQIWDATSGQQVASHSGTLSAYFGLAWSPDSQQVAVGGYGSYILVLDARTGNMVYTYGTQAVQVGDVAWSPDGSRIAAGGSDQVYILNATSGRTFFIYQKQSGNIDALAWSPDSKRIASGSNDSTVHVWQAG